MKTRRTFIKATGMMLGIASFDGLLGLSSSIRETDKEKNIKGFTKGSHMIIDSHCHLKHGDKEKTEYTPEIIVNVMDQVGIDRSIVFAMSTSTKDSIERAEAACKKYPDRLIPYLYALPSYERSVVKEIEAALDKGIFHGIKIHMGECTLAEYVVDPVLKVAGKYRVPCLIDLWGDLEVATRMVTTFPSTPFIMAHMGRYLCKDKLILDSFISLAEKFPNVFLDLSGVILPEMVIEAVKRIGSKRMMWGSDGPHPEPEMATNAQSIPDLVTFTRTELNRITQLKLNEEDENNILGKSIIQLLKL